MQRFWIESALRSVIFNPATGWFVFKHVRPGIYALIISEPEAGSRAYMTAEGDVMVIKVNPGEITSLGDIFLGR
jgi:hypothetical protein